MASQASASGDEDPEATGSVASEGSTVLVLHRLRGPNALAAVRPATMPGFSKMILEYDAVFGAAVLLDTRDGGGLFVIASDFLPESDLAAAATSNYDGFLGPSLASSVRLGNNSGRALAGSVPCTVVELAVTDELRICYYSDEAYDHMIHFRTQRGRSYWPHPPAAAALRSEWLAAFDSSSRHAEAAAGLDPRVTSYQTAEEEPLTAEDVGAAPASRTSRPSHSGPPPLSGQPRPPPARRTATPPGIYASGAFTAVARGASHLPVSAPAKRGGVHPAPRVPLAGPSAFLDGEPMSAEEVEGALADVVQRHQGRPARDLVGRTSKAAAPHTGAPSLFTTEAHRAGLSPTQIQSLVAALGAGPGRLREASPPQPSSGALPSRVAAHFPGTAPASAAEADEWDEEEEGGPAGPPDAAAHLDLRDRMMLDAMELNRQALAQSQQLIEHMARPKAPSDPFGVLDRPDGAPAVESAAGPGTRGFTRRAQWEELLREPTTSAAVASRVRSGLATSLNLPLSDLPATAMERYFTEVSPLADRPWLAYTAAISAALWRAREEQNSARADLLISLLPLFIDQVARDGGRCQHAFLYTGLPEPAWGRIALNRGTPWDQPYSPLADHRWVAAQTAFMADVEAMDQRLRALGRPKGAGGAGADSSAESKAAAKAAAAEAKRLAKAASRQAAAAKAAEAKVAPKK